MTLDDLPPIPSAVAGLALGLLPAGLFAAGHTAIGLTLGLGLAIGGGWLLVGRRAEPPSGDEGAQKPSSFARARAIPPAPIPSRPAPEAPSPAVAAPRASAMARPDVVAPATRHRPALVRIHPGQFTMGSPEGERGRLAWERTHQVLLTRGFLMAETQVTQAQYAAVMGENPACFQGTPADGERPVEQVSWLDAVAYCNALSAAEGLEPAYVIDGGDVTWHREAEGYRLPTEAEWEYAARAGTATATYAGDIDTWGGAEAALVHGTAVLDDIAWYRSNSVAEHPRAMGRGMSTQPVKTKRPNPWGLYDMLGNVWEWTWDRYDAVWVDAVDGQTVDPVGPPDGEGRVVRGGSFEVLAFSVRAAIRIWWLPRDTSRDVGFRPVRFERG